VRVGGHGPAAPVGRTNPIPARARANITALVIARATTRVGNGEDNQLKNTMSQGNPVVSCMPAGARWCSRRSMPWPRVTAMFREWRWRRRGRRILRALNDYALADIGLSRRDAGQAPANARTDLEERGWWV
jgi:uncharacterized protein YjiS (DUF1127 family)